MNKYIVSLLALFALASCKTNSVTDKKGAELKTTAANNIVALDKDQLAQSNLKMALIAKGTISADQHLNGKVDVPPTAIASISIPMGGYVQDINLIPGSFVKKGQVVLPLPVLTSL